MHTSQSQTEAVQPIIPQEPKIAIGSFKWFNERRFYGLIDLADGRQGYQNNAWNQLATWEEPRAHVSERNTSNVAYNRHRNRGMYVFAGGSTAGDGGSSGMGLGPGPRSVTWPCSSRKLLRMLSRADAVIRLDRRCRWNVMANRCASSRMRCSR